MPVIPPWLDVHPSDFAQAAQAGVRAGLERRGQDLSEERSQDELALQQHSQQVQEEIARQRLSQQQKEQEARIGIATEAAARKYQAQRGYQDAVASGVDPIQAMMKFGPLMGQSMSGVGSLGLAQARERNAQIPPSMIFDPNDPKRLVAIRDGSGVKVVPNLRTATAPKPGLTERDIQRFHIQDLQNTIKTSLNDTDVENAKKDLQAIYDEASGKPPSNAGKYQVTVVSPGGGSAAPSAQAPTAPLNPPAPAPLESQPDQPQDEPAQPYIPDLPAPTNVNRSVDIHAQAGEQAMEASRKASAKKLDESRAEASKRLAGDISDARKNAELMLKKHGPNDRLYHVAYQHLADLLKQQNANISR